MAARRSVSTAATRTFGEQGVKFSPEEMFRVNAQLRAQARFLTFEEDVNQLIRDFHGYIHPDDRHKGQTSQKSPDIKESQMGWRANDIREVTRSLIKIQTPYSWENPDLVMEELLALLDRELPQFIVLDSISRFRDLGGDEKARQILRRLIRNLKSRGITSILTAENRGETNSFEEYEVDGVIDLAWYGEMLTLSVKKLRGQKAYKGLHSAAMLTVEDFNSKNDEPHYLISEKAIKEGEPKTTNPGDTRRPYLTVGFNVFPDISIYKEITLDKEDSNKTMKTGTPGLDKLLPVSPTDSGFKRGETILVVGSAGAGKTLLSLNFVFEGFKEKEETKKEEAEKETTKKEKVEKEKVEKENCVWLNFEGKITTLKFAVNGFEGDYKSEREAMIKPAEGPSKGFHHLEFLPINLDLNKIVYTLECLHRKKKIDRLVIDSITELERAKGGGQPAVKVFLAGLIQYLRERQITTVFVCRSEAFFRSIDKIEEQVSSLVDLIICIRNFDIHNQIQKGIYIQKARGRAHKSKIMRLVIDSKKGIDIEDSGWDLENLLAGDASSINSPRIFFKLFYENPAEELINEKIIKDFDEKRYPGDEPKFTLVKKPSIYTEFWSFKGQYSAGHANTRVLSIPDYVISAFRDNKRLAEVDKYIKNEVIQKLENEEYLIPRYSEKPSYKHTYVTEKENKAPGMSDRIIDGVPSYQDYGVMVLRKPEIEYRKHSIPKLASFYTKLKAICDYLEPTIVDTNFSAKEFIYKWDQLLGTIRDENDVEQSKKYNGPRIIPFALPPLDNKSEFVTFFMELLWSHGGDIYKADIMPPVKTNQDKNKNETDEQKKKPEQNKESEDYFREQIRISVFKEFLHLNGGNDKKGEILTALTTETNPKENDSVFKILEDFENRFEAYGLRAKGINIKEFKEWLSTSLEPEEIKIAENIEKESVLKLNDAPFEEAIKLIMRLVYYSGVVNPINGDFRHKAILSRNWYSRIFLLKLEECRHCPGPHSGCKQHTSLAKTGTPMDKEKCLAKLRMKNYQLVEDSYHLLPLPLAAVKYRKDETDHNLGYYRSISCFTSWSLVMLRNALSPEIGGNFIESINAPEYYEERLKNRFGMPVTRMEVNKKRYREYDPTSYMIFDRQLANNQAHQKTLGNIRKAIKAKVKELEDKKSKDKEFEDKKSEGKELEDKKSEGNSKTEIKLTEKELKPKENVFILSEFIELLEDPAEFAKEHENALNSSIFFCRARQPRTAFYQVEEALHYQLKQLFTEDQDARHKRLYRGAKNSNPISALIDICKGEKGLKNGESLDSMWTEPLREVTREFRFHVIFELLTYFYHEYELRE